MNYQHKGPLSGIKVVEFTHWLAGPYCGTIMSDHGAEVTKIESLDGDQVRNADESPEDYLYIAYNHGKKSVSIDLKKKEASEIVKKIIENADIIIENFRPGIMKKLGISYEEVYEYNPKIIFCSISAFGDTPGYVNRPGMDPIVQGMGGTMSMTAQDENSPPILPGIPIADTSTAFMAFGAIATALYERERSGKGQKIELNMIDMMVMNLTTRYGQYLASNENPKPMGNQHAKVVPYQAFPTQNGWMTAGAQTNSAWKVFCQAIEQEDLLLEEKFNNNSKRVENRKELTELLNKIFKTKSTEEWCEIFEKHNILHGPIWGIDELINSDLIKDHNILTKQKKGVNKNVKLIKTPIKYSRTELEVQQLSSELGEYNKEVLQELGYSSKVINELITNKVIKGF